MLTEGSPTGQNCIQDFNFLFQKYFKIYLLFQNNLSLRFQYLYFKRFSLYFKDLACHSRGKSVPCGSYNNLNNKPEITCNNINRGNRKYVIKTWQSKISGFLNIYMDFFMDFREGVQDFRVVGGPSVLTQSQYSLSTTLNFRPEPSPCS